MNTIEEFNRQLRALGMAYRNLYAEFPQFVILGKKESSLCEQAYLATLKPSELAKNISQQKEVLGFKIVRSTEPSYFAVANNLMTEEQFNAITATEMEGSDLFGGEHQKTFLGLPVEKIPTVNGLLYGIVLHNTDRSPTLDTYSELHQAYEYFNKYLFDGVLPNCLITFQREKRTLGYFSRDRFVNKHGETMDELAMNPTYFGVRSITSTLSTLVHEMCHLWQYNFGKPSRAGYHNQEWANKMQEVGLIASATGMAGGKQTGQKMTHYIDPKGRFLKVCKDLISSDFALSWCDRFPPVALADFGNIEKGIMELDEDDGEIDLKEDPIFQPSIDPAHLSFDNQEKGSEKSEGKASGTGKSNRIKYRCPTCKSQCWGKPDLKLKCGEDDCNDALFEEA